MKKLKSNMKKYLSRGSKNMKVGLVTFSSAHNYGALLQAYAMQTYLEKIGLEVDVINYRPRFIDGVYDIYKIKRTNSDLHKIYLKIQKNVFLNLKDSWKIKRYNNFEKFINESLHTTKVYNSLSSIQKDFLNYDILIAGSDQIWNTDLTKGIDPTYFLEFGNKDAVRIAYAPSLGKDLIEEEFKPLYKRYLSNFDFISIREENMRDILGELTSKEMVSVLDPTLLLDREDYDKIKEDSIYKDKEYIYVHFIGNDIKTYEMADYLSRKLNLPVLHNRPSGLFDNELSGNFYESPQQLISVIDNAKYVITNSFHATVFSIVYKKQFLTIPHSKRPERMINLLSMLGLEKCLIEDVRLFSSLEDYSIDYVDVDKRLRDLKKKSKGYLDRAIFKEKNDKSKDNYFYTSNKFNCSGCGLCKDICPVNAIEMVMDEEGFRYPVILEDKCIKCGLCKKSCIYYNNRSNLEKEKILKVYAVSNKNSSKLLSCSSGGVFVSLYEYVIGQGGYVVGVKYNKEMKAVYDITNSLDECEKFKGAKYVEADSNDIKVRVKEILKDNKLVLFTGNPCQIAALKKYLNKDYDNLILVEIICHGVPTSKLFEEYVSYLEKKYGSKVIDFKFRDKEVGWYSGKSMIKVFLEDGRVLKEMLRYNDYNRIFASNVGCRPSCYNCYYAGINDLADITIGDYWGIDKVMPKFYKKHKKGISIFKINTLKGEKIFDKIRSDFFVEESNVSDAYRRNHVSSIILTNKRFDFMKKIDLLPIDKLLRRNNSFKNRPNKKNKKIIDKSI